LRSRLPPGGGTPAPITRCCGRTPASHSVLMDPMKPLCSSRSFGWRHSRPGRRCPLGRPRTMGVRPLGTMSTLGDGISRDPIEEDGGLNLYGMLDNDSISSWDLLGHGKSWQNIVPTELQGYGADEAQAVKDYLEGKYGKGSPKAKQLLREWEKGRKVRNIRKRTSCNGIVIIFAADSALQSAYGFGLSDLTDALTSPMFWELVFNDGNVAASCKKSTGNQCCWECTCPAGMEVIPPCLEPCSGGYVSRQKPKVRCGIKATRRIPAENWRDTLI
jgi:hypothetical protein